VTAVVVGFVPTPEGHAALDRAVDEARLRDVSLVIVTSRRGGREYDDGEAAADQAALDELRTRLDAEGVPHEVRLLVRGREPAEDLIDTANDVQASLLVIGIRHRTPVGKLLLGSDAQRILLEAEVPVLTVKAGQTRP
jgi:nucleotide-binding universal stress UspA family protein